MGRPRKETDKRGNVFQCRLTDDEQAKLRKLAEASGLTESEFIRNLINSISENSEKTKKAKPKPEPKLKKTLQVDWEYDSPFY